MIKAFINSPQSGGMFKVLGLTFAAAFALCVIFTAVLLPLLRRLKAGQSIREEGPQSHQAKSGTPTMGGLAIIAATVITALAASVLTGSFGTATITVCAVTLAYGLIGFIDDYIKVVKKRNLGLTAKQKLALQILIAALAAAEQARISTELYIPFFRVYWKAGWLFIPFVAFVVVAMTNAVNLTDGLDGLAASVTSVSAAAFSLFCGGWCLMLIISRAASSDALALLAGEADTLLYGRFLTAAVFCASLAGACAGFLVFNHHPAKVFMGDTGSLALGGALAAAAIVGGTEFILPFAGLIYVLEALSVIIQVFVFKTQNGRRFFRMAPLHHHFELGGWKETKVVAVFTGVTALLCLLVLLFA